MTFYLLETPTYAYFSGKSMRRIVKAVNLNIKDRRRQLRHQGLSYLKAGHSTGQLYKSHALYWLLIPGLGIVQKLMAYLNESAAFFTDASSQ